MARKLKDGESYKHQGKTYIYREGMVNLNPDPLEKKVNIKSLIGITNKTKSVKSKVESSNQFFENYKDPRWQKKRLMVMERDGFTCCHCYSEDKTLNVHHLIYIKNMNPWEYDPDDLITLCEVCHEKLTKHTNELITIIRKLGMHKSLFYPMYDIIKSVQKFYTDYE